MGRVGQQRQRADLGAALQRGVQRIRDSLYGAVTRGRLPAAECQQRLARLHPATDWAALSDSDAVIEAVYENTAIKQAVMARLHAACAPHTLFISNTSTLDIDELAQGNGRPGQLLGMHFLTPAHVTPLVEVVRGRATSGASLARARALAVRLGKLPVLAGNAWGFIGNRMFEGYLREVDALQLQGVPAQRIDRALEAFGFALGPCRTLDMAGTDLVSQVLAMRGQRADLVGHHGRELCRGQLHRPAAEALQIGERGMRPHLHPMLLCQLHGAAQSTPECRVRFVATYPACRLQCEGQQIFWRNPHWWYRVSNQRFPKR